MAFTGNFEVLQGYNPANFTLTDISSGADATITGRQITLLKADGTPLLPVGNTSGYIDWPLNSGNSKEIVNILPRDYAVNIQVTWTVPTPVNGNIYFVSRVYVLKGYLELFDYSLTQKMAANPNIVRDTTFLKNKSLLRNYLDSAFHAVVEVADQSSAQFLLDLAYQMQLNESILF